MPTLYGNTSTTYTVTASNVSTLYFGSTSTAITATTYSTNLNSLYGGSYSALPSNAAQLIKLFDNNGNVTFFLDPVTNYTTIAANASTSTSTVTSLGNFIVYGNTVSNFVNNSFDLTTNGQNWIFGSDGTITLPQGAKLADTYWTAAPNSQVSLTNNTGTTALSVDNTGTHIQTTNGSTTNRWNFNNDGTTQFPNYKFPAAHGLAGQSLVDSGNGTLYWSTSTGGGAAANQVFDFGSFLVPVSFTLDMGAFI
jgi:hypothetical protein